jgi:hypothetical protein
VDESYSAMLKERNKNGEYDPYGEMAAQLVTEIG